MHCYATEGRDHAAGSLLSSGTQATQKQLSASAKAYIPIDQQSASSI